MTLILFQNEQEGGVRKKRRRRIHLLLQHSIQDGREIRERSSDYIKLKEAEQEVEDQKDTINSKDTFL